MLTLSQINVHMGIGINVLRKRGGEEAIIEKLYNEINRPI